MKKILALYIFMLIMCGCSLDFPPEDEVSDPDAITSITSGKRALAAAYASYDEHNSTLDLVALSDDLQVTPLLAKNPSLKNYYLLKGTDLVFLAKAIWDGNYATIAKINVLLERLEKLTVNTESQEELQALKAQAKSLKALCYFQLLKVFSPRFTPQEDNAYGIVLKDKFELTENQPRANLQESAKAIQDLLDKADNTTTNTYFMSADATQYLQAEVALWVGDYQKAIDFAYPLYQKYLPVMESENPANIWTNKESVPLRLFTLDISSLTIRLYENLRYSKTIGDYLVVNDDIQYEDDDIRKGVYAVPFTRNIGNGYEDIFQLGKYNEQGKLEVTHYYTKFRVAGLVFLCAEAYLKLGQKNKALEIVNNFLALRRSTTISTTMSSEILLDKILQEKQREFVGEPVRFFDLKRNHKSMTKKTFLSSITIEKDDYRWSLPIPPSEIQHNPAIIQNQGWEYINNIK